MKGCLKFRSQHTKSGDGNLGPVGALNGTCVQSDNLGSVGGSVDVLHTENSPMHC